MDWVGAVIIAMAPVSVYVAVRYGSAALERPHIGFLSASATREILTAVAMLLFGLLGLNVLWRGMTGQPLLATSVSVAVLAMGVLLIAVGSLVNLVALIRWDRLAHVRDQRAADEALREQARQAE